MKSLTKIFLAVLFVALVGFTLTNGNEESVEEPVLVEETVVNEAEPVEKINLVNYVDKGTMKASWYGPGFHGRKTANGEIYDQMAFTAAHKSLKFGTLLKVTNPKNNKSVVVRINDRGPYIHGRQLDLSKAAALELGLMKRGVARLKIEEITVEGLTSPVVAVN